MAEGGPPSRVRPAAPPAAGAFDLRDRVAVVTGASSGIGAATARRLAARGCHLVLGARRGERLAALAEELRRSDGVRVLAHPLDVRDAASSTAFGRAADAFAGGDGVHLLVAAAGLARGVARLPEATVEDEADWEEMLDANVMGLLRSVRWFAGGMAARGTGHVVTLGSVAGIDPYEGGSVYCASKAAVRFVTRVLRLELVGTGVRVCCVNPGMVETEFSAVRLGDPRRADDVYRGMTPLGPDEIARAIEWVATLPPFMNVEEIQLQPVDQASVRTVHRREP